MQHISFTYWWWIDSDKAYRWDIKHDWVIEWDNNLWDEQILFDEIIKKAFWLTDIEKMYLKDLREICSDDDLLDLPAYDSISRADKISNAWEALKVIDKYIK